MAPRVKKEKLNDTDVSIELFLKKNRIFSKTSKVEKIHDITIADVYNILDTLSPENIKSIIFQLLPFTDHLERFLYTPDNYTFILFDESLYEELFSVDLSKYSRFTIQFFDSNRGLITK